MRVIITDPLGTLRLCESHGREYATKLGLRWPASHEAASSKRIAGKRVSVSVQTDALPECQWCAEEGERELSDAEIGKVIADVFASRQASIVGR